MTSEETKKHVFEALDNADEGEWAQQDETPREQTLSLLLYCSDLEECTEEDVMPHVLEWRRSKNYA